MNKVKLPKKFREKWLKALRSGEYKQIEGELHNSSGFCCMGVAGVICGLLEEDLYGVGRLDAGVTDIDDIPSNILSTDFAEECMRKNDNGKSFKEIANYIEKNTIEK